MKAPFAILLICWSWSAAIGAEPEKKPETIQVEVIGTIHAGIAAIGGETTGTTITAKGVTWELDFGDHAELKALADKLDGKQATVRGALRRQEGVEIKERWIVDVTAIHPAAEGTRRAAVAPPLKATVSRPDSTVQFSIEGDKTFAIIKSTSGIGGATLQRLSKEWPSPLVVRLRLSGLEFFQATRGPTKVTWSVSNSAPSETRVSLGEGAAEKALGHESPYFSQVDVTHEPNLKKEGKPGFFDVPLPARLFEGNPEEIRLDWIDFYRR